MHSIMYGFTGRYSVLSLTIGCARLISLSLTIKFDWRADEITASCDVNDTLVVDSGGVDILCRIVRFIGFS